MGLYRDPDHNYFASGWVDEDHYIGDPVPLGPFVSVTTALKALDKSGPLVGWATRETAAAAIRNLDVLQTMVRESGAPAAQKWLQTKPGYIKDTAAESGSDIHQLIEAIALGNPLSEDQEALPKVRSYRLFMAEWQPEYVGVEQLCVNFTEAYAGTADIWARLGPNHDLWLLDAKSGRGTYPDMALQLAGLNGAEWWGWPDREELEPAPKAQRFGILHLKDDGYDLIEYKVTGDDYQAFLAIKRAHTWLETRAKEVVLGKVERTAA